MATSYIAASASISACGRYRWQLRRRWAEGGERVCWIMCNPSTARGRLPNGKVLDDQTIRKCVGFSKRWGANALIVVNLFAYRAADPREVEAAIKLGSLTKAIGPGNGYKIVTAARCSQILVAAWGGLLKPWATERGQLLQALPLQCLGTNLDGSPRHPRLVAYTQELEPWPRRN